MSMPDRELLRLHRRATTDVAARMRLPAWEHLSMPLASPMDDLTVRDLLEQIVRGNLRFAAELSGVAPPPDEVDLGMTPTDVVIESVRTVLATVASLDVEGGLSPERRARLWDRVVELTVIGYDLQQAIRAGAGLDDLLVDRICAASPTVDVWPGLEPLEIDLSTPPAQRVLALTGRPPGLWVDASDPSCATGQC